MVLPWSALECPSHDPQLLAPPGPGGWSAIWRDRKGGSLQRQTACQTELGSDPALVFYQAGR